MLWQNEHNPAFSRVDGDAPAYLPVEHQTRWHRLRMARSLFEGRHSDFFVAGRRTQFDYPASRAGDRTVRLYITFNLLRLMSLKFADLLYGTKAKLDAPSVRQTDALDLLVRRCKFHARIHTAAVQRSWAGGAYLESMIWRGEPYVVNIKPDEIFPLGERGPDDQYEWYVRYATANVGTDREPITLLLETSYGPGIITRRLWQLAEGERRREITLGEWPTFKARAAEDVPKPDTVIPLGMCPITYLPNEAGGDLEVSDYDGLLSFQDTVNAKFAQVARVLAKHSDPKLGMPASAADKDGKVRSDHDVFFYRTKDEIPSYITWSAELTAAMADRDSSIDAFCTQGEISQVLLGIRRGGAIQAAKALRLEATNTLARVGRNALNDEPAIARSLDIAQRLDQTTSLRRSYPVEPIGVEMRDGLPKDELDESTIISNLRAAGVMSLEAAVERRVEDPDAAATEVSRIREEDAAKAAALAPPIFHEPAAPATAVESEVAA